MRHDCCHMSVIPLLKILLHSVGHVCSCVESLQSCPTLCNPMDCSPPGFSVHGILQARLLEWVAMPSSRESSPPRDRTRISRIASRFFTAEPLWKPPASHRNHKTVYERPRGTPWSMLLSLSTNFNCLAKWELSLYLLSFWTSLVLLSYSNTINVAKLSYLFL